MIEKIRWDIIILYIDVAFQDLTPSLYLTTSPFYFLWDINIKQMEKEMVNTRKVTGKY